MVDRMNQRQPWAAANIQNKILTKTVGRGEKELQADEVKLMAEDFGHSENSYLC